MALAFNRRVIASVVDVHGQGKAWEGLRTAFRFEHTSGSRPSPGRVEVYGLARESQVFIKNEGKTVVVQAGYEDAVATVFAGDIAYAYIATRPPEVITTIEAGDGEEVFLTARSSFSLARERTTNEVLDRLLADFGLPIAAVSAGIEHRTLSGPYVAHGRTAFYLDELARDLEFRWFVRDGALVVIDEEAAVTERAQLVTPDTGLIGSPEPLVKRGRSRRPRVTGVQWNMLLSPTARPGDLFQVESRDVNGFFVADKVTHTGDSGFDSQFYTQVEARQRQTRSTT